MTELFENIPSRNAERAKELTEASEDSTQVAYFAAQEQLWDMEATLTGADEATEQVPIRFVRRRGTTRQPSPY